MNFINTCEDRTIGTLSVCFCPRCSEDNDPRFYQDHQERLKSSLKQLFSVSLSHVSHDSKDSYQTSQITHLPLTAPGDRMLQLVTLRVYQIEVHLPYEIRANRVRRIFKTIIELVVAVARQPVGKYPPIFFHYHLLHPYNNNNNKIIIIMFLSSPCKFPKKRTLTLSFSAARSIFTSDSCEVAAGHQSRLQFARGVTPNRSQFLTSVGNSIGRKNSAWAFTRGRH